MIANPNWFKQRKYSGWGLTPTTWQGWAYIALITFPIATINHLPIPDNNKTVFMFLWAALFMVDTIHTMFKIKRDERDIAHEALAERNALWIMILTLIIGLGYQSAKAIIQNNPWTIDPVIIIALLTATATKAITHLYLKNK